MITKNYDRCRFFILIGIVLCAVAAKTSAATFTVTNTNDSGAGSLRQAINNANSVILSFDVIEFNIPGVVFERSCR